MDIEPGTVIAQRYRVQRQLGRGGMGEVFAAENIRTGRVVAVKLLRADTKQKSSAVARFRREARAAGAIHSDYVTQVLDVEEDADHGIVIVFELLEGESLIDRLKRTGPMSFDEIFPIVEQVWIGLADAHASGVIHRDLKPSNVFLEKRPDGSHRVKILDFGISKLTREVGGETLTEMGQNLGTFSFMPPEQIGKAKTVDHRADIYSCATLIYQAMSGQLPYAARNILMIVELKAKAEPRPLSQVMDTPVDPRLEDFLTKSLKRDPVDRYQTALEALEAWRMLRQSRPQQARAPMPSGGQMAAQNLQATQLAPQQQVAPQQQAPQQQLAPQQMASHQQQFAQPQSSVQSMQPQQGRGIAPGTIAMQQGMPGMPQRSPSQSNFQAISALPSVASVADSTSDAGSDNVATVAIPMKRVNEALAQRGFAPASSQRSQPGAGLPRLHDDRPNLGTQLMRQGGASQSSPSIPAQNVPSATASSSGVNPIPSRMGTMAMPSQPMSQPNYAQQQNFAASSPTPMPGSPMRISQSGGMASPVTPNPHSQGAGPGGTARHQPIRADDPAPAGDLQTAVYKREAPPPTLPQPGKRSPVMLVLGMLLFLVLGFAIVAAVVWGVTGKLPLK